MEKSSKSNPIEVRPVELKFQLGDIIIHRYSRIFNYAKTGEKLSEEFINRIGEVLSVYSDNCTYIIKWEDRKMHTIHSSVIIDANSNIFRATKAEIVLFSGGIRV